MGRILCSRIKIIAAVSETVGYKSGLTLSKNEMAERLPEYIDIWNGDEDDGISIRSEVFSDMIFKLLHKIGSIPTLKLPSIGRELYSKYGDNPKHEALLLEIIDFYGKVVPEIQKTQAQNGEPFNLDPFMELVLAKYGSGIPIKIAIDYIEALRYFAYINPWSEARYKNWKDTVELSRLFKSESLFTYYGHFFDQRFIDYLYQNFDDIDKIHWRQFEALTAEFYVKEGFHVNIGPGRDDGGIDARVWPTEKDTDKPPLILIQCKRQKEKINKVIVKALWADTQAENAESGLIVTTNSLSIGAEKVVSARAYPINVADRKTLQQWLIKMRTPYTGVFLGE